MTEEQNIRERIRQVTSTLRDMDIKPCDEGININASKIFCIRRDEYESLIEELDEIGQVIKERFRL